MVAKLEVVFPERTVKIAAHLLCVVAAVHRGEGAESLVESRVVAWAFNLNHLATNSHNAVLVVEDVGEVAKHAEGRGLFLLNGPLLSVHGHGWCGDDGEWRNKESTTTNNEESGEEPVGQAW